MAEVVGMNGESIVFDGVTVAKYRHHGKDEAARNPVSTFREVTVTEKTSLFGKPKNPPQFDVMLAMSSFMSLTVDAAGKAAFDAMMADVRAAAGR